MHMKTWVTDHGMMQDLIWDSNCLQAFCMLKTNKYKLHIVVEQHQQHQHALSSMLSGLPICLLKQLNYAVSSNLLIIRTISWLSHAQTNMYSKTHAVATSLYKPELHANTFLFLVIMRNMSVWIYVYHACIASCTTTAPYLNLALFETCSFWCPYNVRPM